MDRLDGTLSQVLYGKRLVLDMKLGAVILCLFLCACPCVLAQDQYFLTACPSPSSSGKVVGGNIKLHLPKGAIVKTGHDVDYSDYAVGFGPKKSRVWLQGISGSTATSGKVPEDWLLASVEVKRRTWKFAGLEGVDAKGKLANGNYWRYLGQYGESIRYYDVPAEAAAYFDHLLNNVCFASRCWSKTSDDIISARRLVVIGSSCLPGKRESRECF